MRKVFLSVILITLAFNLQNLAQVKKGKKSAPPVRAIVTIKTGQSLADPSPSESDDGIWNGFYSKKFGFRIELPAKLGDVFDDEKEGFSTFETATKKASYGVMLKSLPVTLNNRELAELYETVIAETEDSANARTISKRDVYLDGKLGKEIIFEEKGRRVFTRYYILEQKLFMLSVSLQKEEYSIDFDNWVKKFFDSFSVDIRSNQEI